MAGGAHGEHGTLSMLCSGGAVPRSRGSGHRPGGTSLKNEHFERARMGRRVGVDPEDTRRELLDATIRVLLKRGYEGTRVAEIASEAGVTAGAIYNHFSSKSELLKAAVTERAPSAISMLMAEGEEFSVI